MRASVPGGEDKAPAAVVSADRANLRGAQRHTVLIRAAKLIVGAAEYLCILRDASESGVSVKLFHELAPSPRMVLELQNEERHPVELVWHAGDRMGLRFPVPVDIHRLIEMPAPFNRRPIRMRVTISGVIGIGEDATMCTVLDLSLQGAKIACDRAFAIDQRVKLMASGLPNVHAKVRWRSAQQLGLAFENTFQLGELAQIVAAANALGASEGPIHASRAS